MARQSPGAGAEVEYVALPRFRYMLIDRDGQRVGRLETARLDWKVGDEFELEGDSWQIVEMLPEVSTAITYNAVWVVAPPDVG